MQISEELAAGISNFEHSLKAGDRARARADAQWLVAHFPEEFAFMQGASIEAAVKRIDAARGERPWAGGVVRKDPVAERVINCWTFATFDPQDIHGRLAVNPNAMMRAMLEAMEAAERAERDGGPIG